MAKFFFFFKPVFFVFVLFDLSQKLIIFHCCIFFLSNDIFRIIRQELQTRKHAIDKDQRRNLQADIERLRDEKLSYETLQVNVN